jgi:hypothetical protein
MSVFLGFVGVVLSAKVARDVFFRPGDDAHRVGTGELAYLLVSAIALAYYRPDLNVKLVPRLLTDYRGCLDGETTDIVLELIDRFVADAVERSDEDAKVAWERVRGVLTK